MKDPSPNHPDYSTRPPHGCKDIDWLKSYYDPYDKYSRQYFVDEANKLGMFADPLPLGCMIATDARGWNIWVKEVYYSPTYKNFMEGRLTPETNKRVYYNHKCPKHWDHLPKYHFTPTDAEYQGRMKPAIYHLQLTCYRAEEKGWQPTIVLKFLGESPATSSLSSIIEKKVARFNWPEVLAKDTDDYS